MPYQRSFFSHVENDWRNKTWVRDKYSDSIPLLEKSYFKPVRSIEDFSNLMIRPIEKPLWLGINTIGFLIKAAVFFVASVLLMPCALLLAIVAPSTELQEQTFGTFKSVAAQTGVSLVMAGIAFLSMLTSLFLNPLYLVTRLGASVLDHLNDTTEACFGLTIAKL